MSWEEDLPKVQAVPGRANPFKQRRLQITKEPVVINIDEEPDVPVIQVKDSKMVLPAFPFDPNVLSKKRSSKILRKRVMENFRPTFANKFSDHGSYSYKISK